MKDQAVPLVIQICRAQGTMLATSNNITNDGKFVIIDF
jgi:hypothetical protein